MALGPTGHVEEVRALAANDRHLVIGGLRASSATVLTVYDHVAEKVARTIDVPAHVYGLHVTAKEIHAACADGKVRVHALHDGALARTLDAHTGACRAISCYGNLLATAGDDGTVRLWDLASGKKKGEHALSSRPLRAVAFENATTFAAGGDDGVIRLVRDGATKDLPGHEGPVTCLAFTPSDGRLVSGGEDGTFRIWYASAAAAVESEVRSKDDTLHVGGTTAVLFLPAKNPADAGDRVATAGFDGKVRVWRMSERRKPRTLDGGTKALHALAFAPSTRAQTIGTLFAAGDARTLNGFAFDADGAPTDTRIRLQHGLDLLEGALAGSARPQRESAIKTLASYGEADALALLVKHLDAETDAELRALALAEIAANDRRDARKAVRARLDDDHKLPRAAAFAALRKLEPEAPLAPLRSALASRFADVRVLALEALGPLASSSPLAAGLVAASLADDDANVRKRALRELVAIHPKNGFEPLRIGFERGRADIRAEVLVRGATTAAKTAELSAMVEKALDDEDAEVRRIAFVASALARPSLAGWLAAHDEAFSRALDEVVRRACDLAGTGASAPPGVDSEPATVKSLSSHFVQFTHPRHGEVAIFKPTIHTPIEVGDTVYLKDVVASGAQYRASDYVVGSFTTVSDAQLADMRARLVAPPPKLPSEKEREPLLAALACRTADTSLRGARGLAIAGDMRALGALLTISREPSPALRREAALALVALQDPRAKRRLAWMLNDAESAVRDAALECYRKLEADPLLVAEAALHASHEDMRVRGLDVLVKQGKGKPTAETLLADAIEDEAPKVRSEAFATLWAWHPNEPLATIDRALVARFPDLRLRAVRELADFAKKRSEPLAAPSLERLAKTIGDRDYGVAKAAYDATLEIRGKDSADTHLAAIGSTHPALRVQGAKDATKAQPDRVRSPLSKLLEDVDARVRVAAIETLDVLLPADPGPVLVGLQSSHLDLRVRAAELLAVRREDALVDPMRALVADKDLLARNPAEMVPLRQRAASALATLGTARLLKYFATELVKDDDPVVREQAARGVSNASRRGEEGYLLDLLAHADLPVRSWAADGLARLGDARALPVLTGSLRHEHAPIRVGSILSFAALGPEGYGGMLQGLEDPSRDVQRVVLSVILARDLRAFRHGEPPDLLTSALSSQRPEVRFAAARALELRITPEQYIAYLVEVLLPDKPERAADMEKWPSEEQRARAMVGLAEALAGDRPEQRYAAAQALRLRDRPLDYFREVQRATAPRSVKAPWVPDTTPRAPVSDPPPAKGPLAFVRKLFSRGPEGAELPPIGPVEPGEQQRLRQLAFGAYVGLLRQASEDDESHRVRRDAIERILDLVATGHASLASATPALARALDDPNHLVRQAAFAALKKAFASDPEVPLSLALASNAGDVVRAALDELATRGDAAKPRIAKALDSRVAAARKYAFELLEKSSPPGSVEPLIAALGSEHADIRIGVLASLATSRDPRVAVALGKALESDHDDLRLRAAEMLAQRKDDRAADALAPWLKSDDAAIAARARDALALLGSPAAVRALATRFDDGVPEAERIALVNAIAGTRAGVAAIDALVASFADDDAPVRAAAVEGCLAVLGPRADAEREHGAPEATPRDVALGERFYTAASRARHADVRLRAAQELDDHGDAKSAESMLVALFGDRDARVRAAAVRSYAARVAEKDAPAGPLEDVLRAGARETMLAAAEGLAHRQVAGALRALLLYVRAGDVGEPERALLALGTLGDKRALAEIEAIANGGTEEAPADVGMQAAAVEALGRLEAKLDAGDRERVRDKIESSVGTRENVIATAAVRALRWLGGERARARIEGVLASTTSSESERIEAAKALGELGDTAAEAALGGAVRDTAIEVAWSALEALEKLFPKDRTRVELLAVESPHAAIAKRAATYLADEGDAGLLLAKLAKLTEESLRQRLRFGLVRRKSVPSKDLERLLADASPRARADAAWVVAVRALTSSDVSLASSLILAARRAETSYAEAIAKGDRMAMEAEASAWLRALWAARMVDVVAVRSDARRWLAAGVAAPAPAEPPPAVRVEATFALHRGKTEDLATLGRALLDRSLDVRSAAAAALAPAKDPLALATVPFDAVRIGLAGEGSLATPEGRRAFLPSAIRRRDTNELASLARARETDAMAALGRVGGADAIRTLSELAAKGGAPDEKTRKAAYRALRRAQRKETRS